MYEPVVVFDDGLDNRQPESGAFGTACPVAAIKTVEHPWKVLRRNASPLSATTTWASVALVCTVTCTMLPLDEYLIAFSSTLRSARSIVCLSPSTSTALIDLNLPGDSLLV